MKKETISQNTTDILLHRDQIIDLLTSLDDYDFSQELPDRLEFWDYGIDDKFNTPKVMALKNLLIMVSERARQFGHKTGYHDGLTFVRGKMREALGI